MKTIKKVDISFEYGDIPEWEDMKPGVIYINKEYGFASHLCLCGCGEKVAMPLSKIIIDGENVKIHNDQKDWWTLTEEKGKITLHPSIGNYSFPCKSHYIITKSIANFV